MADAQIAIIDGDQTQVVLAPGENPAIVTSIPGPQGPAGAGVPLGGTTNQVLFKQSGTNYDTAWGPITSAMIGDLEIVNADVSASAAIAGTKISPNFGSQNVVTTGTSTAASFIPSSSTVPTNGLYLSAANSVALSTNGQGRLFVDPNGKIGIATSSPDVDLHLGITPLSTGSAGVIGFGDIGGYRMAEIEGIRQDGSFAGSLIFRTQTAGSSGFSGAERLRITSTGQLSHIGAGSSGSPAVSFSGSAASNSLVVDSSSRVGIGNSVPGSFNAVGNRLVIGSGSGNQGATIFSGSTSTSSLIFAGSVGGTQGQIFYRHNDNSFGFITNTNVSALNIDSSGRLGIGTASPDQLVHLSASTDATLRIESTSTALTTDTVVGRIEFEANDGSAFGTGIKAAIGAYSDIAAGTSVGLRMFAGSGSASTGTERYRITGDGQHIFGGADGISSTERFRCDSSGRLLVGTASAVQSEFVSGATNTPSFQLVGSSQDTAHLAIVRSSAAGAPTLSLNSNPTAADNGLGFINWNTLDGSVYKVSASIAAYSDATPGVNDRPSRLVFSTTADGASSPTERMRIDNAGTTTLTSAAATAPFIAKISTTETARIDSSGRLLVGTSSVSGLNAAKTVISETSAVAAQRIVGNSNAQGAAQKITVVRHYPVVSLGTKLVIPIVSQSNLNISTLCKVWGLGARYNSATPLPFEINFAFGHSTSISNLTSWGGQGNYSSIAVNGMNIEITFTTAYTNVTANGVYVCLEYMTPRPDDSVNVASIAMN